MNMSVKLSRLPSPTPPLASLLSQLLDEISLVCLLLIYRYEIQGNSDSVFGVVFSYYLPAWPFYPKISCFIKQVCKSQANLSMGFTYAVAIFRSHAILSVQQFSTMSDTAIRSRAYI